MKETKKGFGFGKGLLIVGAGALVVGLVTNKLKNKREQDEEFDLEDEEYEEIYDEEDTCDEEEE